MTPLALKAVALASLTGMVCATSLPAFADDIPASPMNHGGFSMPTPASAGLEAPPPPPAAAEPPMPETPMKKKMAKKKMKRTPAPEAAAADGKM